MFERSENEQKEDSAMSGFDRRASVYNRRASILTEPKDLSIGIGMLDPREIIANQRAMEAASNITDWLVKNRLNAGHNKAIIYLAFSNMLFLYCVFYLTFQGGLCSFEQMHKHSNVICFLSLFVTMLLSWYCEM